MYKSNKPLGGRIVQRGRARSLESVYLRENSSSTIYGLYDFGQVTKTLCASVSLSEKEGG